jgi:hypothetical protein
MQTPLYSHLAIYSSPLVLLVHLVTDPIPLGLQIARQKVSEDVIPLGYSLVMLYSGFFKHFSGLLDFHLAGFLVLFGIQTLRPTRL